MQLSEDPLAVVRDPNHEMIDTKLMQTIEELKQTGSPQLEIVRV